MLLHGLMFQEGTLNFLAKISALSGYLSISFWLFAQIPQVIKNHTDKSVDGFALGFLLCWFGGDFLNLISCLLNDAMAFQILLSGYYCLIDIILALQYYYYKNMYHNPNSKWYHPQRRRYKHIHSPRMSLRHNLEVYGSIDNQINNKNNNKNNNNSSINHNNTSYYKTVPRSHVKGVFKKQNTGITNLVSTALLTSFQKVQGLPILNNLIKVEQEKENNSIIYKLIHYFLTLDKFKLGKFLAWSCTFLYLISRIPQLYTNYKLKSTKGVSLKLICFALFGNFFYSMSLLLSKSSLIGGDISKEFWDAEISYFIGAMGTVFFDFIVLTQWYLFDFKSKYRRTKSGKLKLISPKLNVSPNNNFNMNISSINNNSLNNNNNNSNNNNVSQNMIINSSSNSLFKHTDPINMSTSVRSTLSPSHMKKLSEFTPLSPMDFLLDDYMAANKNSKKSMKSTKSSIHTTLAITNNNTNNTNNNQNNNNNNNNNKGKAIHSNVIPKTEEDLNMSMDEDA